MLEKKEINEVVKTAFKTIYVPTKEYKLFKVEEHKRLNHITYAIIHEMDGIICEFSVSDTGVYSASSKGDLLYSKHRTELWLSFITLIKETLEELQ